MRSSPIECYLYRPLYQASRTCTNKLGQLYQKVRPYTVDHRLAKSIAGRITLCAAAETIGGIAGSYLGEAILGTAFREMGKTTFPLLAIPVSFLSIKHRTARIALTALGLTALLQGPISIVQLSQWGATGGLAAGEFLGKNIGMILGGYAGLKAVDSNIPFWDPSTWCDSYLIGMTKYLFAGEVFNAVIARSTLPYINVPINFTRGVINWVFKTLAYNSNPLISTVKEALREKRVSQDVIVPLFVKMFCNRYCEANAAPLTTRIINIISQTLNAIPQATTQFRSLLKTPLIFDALQSKLKSLSKKTDRLTIILMRGFRDYIKLYKNSIALKVAYQNYLENPKVFTQQFKDTLKKEIPNAPLLSTAFAPLTETFNKTSESIIQAIQQIEFDLVGVQLTQDTELLQETLAIHLKYFLIQSISKHDSTPLTPEEEKIFFHEVNDVIFSLYKTPSCSHKIARFISTTNKALISSFFGFKRWVYPLLEQPEQRALILTEPKIEEERFERPDADSEYQIIENK